MNIWSAWLQGREKAPPVARGIFDLWERLNPDDTFHVVEHVEAREILRTHGIDIERLNPQVATNLIRMHLT